MHIGDSINEAIDWTQDRLATTRPLAEQTLFSLLAEHAVYESSNGFVLREAKSDEVEKHHHRARGNGRKNYRKFRMQRKHDKHKLRNLFRLDNPEIADQAPDEDE